MTTIVKYTQRLTFELRLRDVPGDVIGDAIAQVESHIAETGEDPVDAFGPAREYAATFGQTTSPARRWPWYFANWLIGFVFGCVLIIGILGQVRGEDVFWGIHPAIAIVIGVLGLVGYIVAIVAIWADRVKDPRRTQPQVAQSHTDPASGHRSPPGSDEEPVRRLPDRRV